MVKNNGAAILLEAAKNTLSPGGSGSKIDSSDIAQAIASGSQIARDKVYYIRSIQAASNGQRQILDESISKQRGITNFDKGAIRKSSAMVVTGIRVASVTNAAITDAAITNGEIYITDNNGKELFSGPIASLLPASAPLKPGDDYFELDQPILLQPGQTVKIDIFFPTATAANTNIEVSLKGVENQAR
jgi:uncharacterized protein (UPF0371 family)